MMFILIFLRLVKYVCKVLLYAFFEHFFALINQAGAFLVPGKSPAVAEETELEEIHSSDDYVDTASLLEQVTLPGHL